METTPIGPAFPIIEIGGRKLVVKFDSLARFRMSAMGISISDLFRFKRVQAINETDPEITSIVLKFFACAVANNFIDVEDPAAPARIPTPEYWAAVMPDELWIKVGESVMQALIKVFPPRPAPAAAEQSEGATTTQPN